MENHFDAAPVIPAQSFSLSNKMQFTFKHSGYKTSSNYITGLEDSVKRNVTLRTF